VEDGQAGRVQASALERVRRVEVRPSPIERIPIRSVEILPHNVYEPDSAGRISALHRLANRLHIRTRPSTVRHELLFRSGDPWSEHAALETARNLRALDYLEPERIAARLDGDSVRVRVETRDRWTTQAELNIEAVGGKRTGTWGLKERNLLGLGKYVSLLYRQTTTGVTRSLDYVDPNLRGSRVRLRLGVAKSTEGAGRRLEVGQPFYAEATPRAWEIRASAATSVAHLYQDGCELADFDRRDEVLTLAHGWRLPSAAPITRLTASFELQDRRYGASRLEPDAPVEFAGPEQSDRRRMLALELRLWDPSYVEVVDVDRMDRLEDLDVGTSVRLKVGFAPRAFGSTASEGYGRLRLAVGAANALGFGWIRGGLESRVRHEPFEVMSHVEGRWYFVTARHTLVIAAMGEAGERMPRPYQLVVGGLNGLRAFDPQALAGRRLWRLNAEERWIVTPRRWQVLRAATAVFVDAARVWGPGAGGAGWFRDAGVGLRLGFPRVGLTRVLRLDVAWPIEPLPGGRREPVLSIGTSQAF
jgi:hypothetical protein